MESKGVPERLWKYRKWNQHARDMIVHGEIYFSNIEQLNDPFEFRWTDVYPQDPFELDQYVKNILAKRFPYDTVEQRRRRYPTLLRQAKELARQGGGRFPTSARIYLGVFSVAAINDDILMWSHYADFHMGVCIGIRPRLIGKRFCPVEYVDHVPDHDVWNYVIGDRDKFVALSATKFKRWEYEEEWRTVSKRGKQCFPGCVDQIVVGVRASDATREDVRKAVAESGHAIHVIDAKLSTREYAVVIPNCEFPVGETKQQRERKKAKYKRAK